MMFTAGQLVAHAVGDYVLQSHWMATEKVKRSIAAAVHVAFYTLPFLFLTRAPAALAVIAGTHFVIDRWRLARYVSWFKNFLGPMFLDSGSAVTFGAWRERHPDARRLRDRGSYRFALYVTNPRWRDVDQATGFAKDVPVHIAFWLVVIVDNIMHIVINAGALRWLT